MASVASRNLFDILADSEDAESVVSEKEPTPKENVAAQKKVDRSRANPKENRIRHEYPQRGGFKSSPSNNRNEDTRSGVRYFMNEFTSTLCHLLKQHLVIETSVLVYPIVAKKVVIFLAELHGELDPAKEVVVVEEEVVVGVNTTVIVAQADSNDSEKKENQGWGNGASNWGNNQTTEETTTKGETDTNNVTSSWGNETTDNGADSGWGAATAEEQESGAAQESWVAPEETITAEWEQKEESTVANGGDAPVVEQEESFKTLDEYRAEKAPKAQVATLPEARKANEGVDDSQWKDAVPLEKDEEEDVLFAGKELVHVGVDVRVMVLGEKAIGVTAVMDPQKTLAASQCLRRLVTTADCETETISNLGQGKLRNPRHETTKKVDDPVGIVTSLLTDSVQEIVQARDNAINTFKELGLEFIGWYRRYYFLTAPITIRSSQIKNISLLQHSSKSKFNSYSERYQQTSKTPITGSVGVIVSVSSVSCPPINSRTPVVDGMLNSLCAFRTPAENSSDEENAVKSKNGKIWKGKGKECHKVNKLTFNVNRQAYMCPNVMQQLSCALMAILHEAKQIYSGQVLDCDNRNGQRILVDYQYEAFLMNFLKKSVLQLDRSIEQDFRSLAVAKHHVKEIIMKRINEILQRRSVSNENEMQLKRGKIEKLIEKRISKREKDTKISENTDGVIQWLNKGTSNGDQKKNTCENLAPDSGETTSSKTSDAMPQNKIQSFHSSPRQFTPIKESSQFINTIVGNDQEDRGASTDAVFNNKSIDIDALIKKEAVPVSGGAGDECTKKTDKQLLRKLSIDASHTSPPNSKKIKTSSNPTMIDFGGVHVQAAAFPDSKPTFSSNDAMNGSSTHHSNSRSTTSQSSQYSPSAQSTVNSSPTFATIAPLPPTTPPSSSTHINISTTSSSLGTTQNASGIQYSYPYSTNGYRSFHGSEDLPACNGSKPPNNCPQGSGIHLPSIQGLLEISHNISQPPPSPLPNGVMTVDSNSPGLIHSPFSSPMLQSYQNNQFYPFGHQLPKPPNLIQPGTPPSVASIPHPIHQINSNVPPPSANSRHYIPIAPSPSPSNRPPLQSSQPATTIYTSSTRYPSNDSDYHRW
ncbi:3774_t:CDS:10 [Acaulospora colombiana]|uniref:3774_t:CDS:1 n=1 Tax=Acaulospora colombiana TaxID=27376 RepID=A0ACA9KBR3_9GLOM|nr:3774_t:CDS:10 [Acaulospora colombiana]